MAVGLGAAEELGLHDASKAPSKPKASAKRVCGCRIKLKLFLPAHQFDQFLPFFFKEMNGDII